MTGYCEPGPARTFTFVVAVAVAANAAPDVMNTPTASAETRSFGFIVSLQFFAPSRGTNRVKWI